ncbi:MAG: dinitrogenase iron-molybdenum cofactor biosynthesis protein [Clostridia bacterium]|nr:dinitrogenase iron-molybdenum cofactor biosynthesis protein [Clostridia bacterium]
MENGEVADSKVIDTSATGHGALVEVLNTAKVDVLICGGIGGGAQMALAQAGIKLYGGVSGNADEVVTAFLQNNLQYNPDVHCDHHDHAHGEGHTCGDHKCH